MIVRFCTFPPAHGLLERVTQLFQLSQFFLCLKTFDSTKNQSFLSYDQHESPFLFLSLRFNGQMFSRWTWVSRYQNVSILDYVGVKDDGGGDNNWSDMTCILHSSSQIVNTNIPNPNFLLAGCPSCHRTNSVRALKGKSAVFHGLSQVKLTGGSTNLVFDYCRHIKSWLLCVEDRQVPLAIPLMPLLLSANYRYNYSIY